MATSTSTLLQTVNDVLLHVGERQVTSFSSYPAQKAVNFCQEGLQELLDANDWMFNRSRITATSWTDEVATVAEFRRLLGVSVRLSSGFRNTLSDVSWDEFSQFTPTEGIPSYFLMVDNETVHFHPYPAVAEQDNVIFDVIPVPALPTATTDTFPVPERFMRFIIAYATARMKQDHLDDASAASLDYQRADAILTQLIRREQTRSVGGRNMWRGSRPYNR